MKYTIAISLLFFLFSCNEKKSTTPVDIVETDSSLLIKGKYLVGIIGCHDCHTPKVMTAQGMDMDMTRMLSGYASTDTLPAFDLSTSKNWLLFNMGLNAFKGPWGTSFAANLTPDATGLGSWTLERFSNAIRKGDFKGMPGSRKLLPPMPWQGFSTMKDEDVAAIFAYLQNIPPVMNRVPDALSPLP